MRYEKGISELAAARRANKFGLLYEYIYCRRHGFGIIEALEEWDLLWP